MDPLIKTALLRTFGFLLWAALSAWLFVIVEYTEENGVQGKYQLLYSLYESMASKYNMTIEEFNNFTNVAHEALSAPKPQWTYFAAMDFVFQAITTIGYGYITPQTPTGQILCMFVSLLGIPITMLALKSVGEVIAKWVNALVTKFERKILKKPEPKRMRTKSAVILLTLMVALIVVNGLLVEHFTNWSLLEGVYFWFVTFTTIGFGDYVVNNPQRIRQLSTNSSGNHDNKAETVDAGEVTASIFFEIFFTFYFILGLCVVSSVLNSIMAAIEERKCRFRCPGCVPRKPPGNTDNEQNSTSEHVQHDPNMTYLSLENFGFHKEKITTGSETEIQ